MISDGCDYKRNKNTAKIFGQVTDAVGLKQQYTKTAKNNTFAIANYKQRE